jgi:hypothetical protein
MHLSMLVLFATVLAAAICCQSFFADAVVSPLLVDAGADLVRFFHAKSTDPGKKEQRSETERYCQSFFADAVVSPLVHLSMVLFAAVLVAAICYIRGRAERLTGKRTRTRTRTRRERVVGKRDREIVHQKHFLNISALRLLRLR